MTDRVLPPGSGRKLLRQLLPVALTTVLLVAVYFLLPLDSETWWIWSLAGVAALIGAMPLTFRRAMRVMSSPQPLIDGIGALTLVLNFLVLGFAATYYAMATHGDQFHGLDSKIDSLYFTVVTLGTVGYGDIVPTGDGARMLVTVQILFDLLFIGSAIKVLAMATRKGMEARRGATPVADFIAERETPPEA